MANERRVHDRALLDALEETGAKPFDQEVWRIARRSQEPLRGSTSRGRWSPAGEFEVLYTSLERNGALTEVGYRLSLEPVWPSGVEHDIHSLHVRAERIIDIRDLDTLARLGIDVEKYASLDYSRTQAVAAAVHFLEFDGMIVSSARYDGLNLVLFSERIDQGVTVRVIGTAAVDWTSWRKPGRRTTGGTEG